MTGETVMAVTSVIGALCDAIERTTPEEMVAELDPIALVKLAKDAEVGSAWLGALQVLAACAAKGAPNRPAGDVDDDLLCPSNKNAAHPRLDLFLHGSGTPVIHVDVADDRHRG